MIIGYWKEFKEIIKDWEEGELWWVSYIFNVKRVLGLSRM